MQTEHYYDVAVRWDGARKGTLSANTLQATIEVATPPEFPKGIPGIWSPEHLLVAAVNSCLMTTFLAIADQSKLAFSDFQCRAVGKLEVKEGRYMISEVEMRPVVVIGDEADRQKALRILQKSEAACLITNSLKAEVTMVPEVRISAVA